MKRVLITNDDGVSSSGILAAKNSIINLVDEVIIVAPANQQSAIGRALTLASPLRLNETSLNDGFKAFSVSGTPTDAVELGILEIMDEKPDLVVSGINVGHNTGKSELTTSGTISAAMEAASLGIPSIAVSQEVTNDEIKFEKHVNLNYDFTKKILSEIVEKVLKKGLPKGADLLNLNVPANVEKEELLITRLGERMYTPVIHKRLDPRGKPYYWIGGESFENNPLGTDNHALKVLKQPTLTPLKLDNTADLNCLKNW